MDVKQLVTFLTFVEEESFNRVSQKLNYSVSTLVSHIKSLENEFNVELVSNHGRRSQLTAAGRAFVPYAHQIVDQYQEAIVAMSNFSEISGELKVAVSEMVSASRLASLFPDFSKKNPSVKLSVRTGSTSTCKEIMLGKMVDVAFLQDFSPMRDDRVTSVPLYFEPIILVSAPDHPLAKQDTVGPRDLRYQSLFLPRLDYAEQPAIKAALETGRISVSDNLSLESGQLLRQAVKERRGIAFLPLSSAKQDLERGTLVRLPWAGDQPEMTVYAMYDNHSMVLPAIQELTSFIKAMIHTET